MPIHMEAPDVDAAILKYGYKFNDSLDAPKRRALLVSMNFSFLIIQDSHSSRSESKGIS